MKNINKAKIKHHYTLFIFPSCPHLLNTPKFSSLGHAKHRCRKEGFNRKERMGYKYHVFKIVKGHKGVSLHAEVSVKASGTPEAAAAEILTQLLALASPLKPHRVCRVTGNLRVQPKHPFILSHTHWWQMQAKSTSLPHAQVLLSQAAAATVPLKQSNMVLSESLSRERHLMNPPHPLYTGHKVGLSWQSSHGHREDKAQSQPRWAGANFISNDTQTHSEFLTTPAPLFVVPSSGPDTSTRSVSKSST